MARKKDKSAKEPGRLKQMWQVFKMTRRYDSRAVLYISLGLALPILVGIAVAFIFFAGDTLNIVLWIVVGVMGGVLLGMLILGRRAERAAYSQILGKPGAVGAVLRSSLKRGWIGNEEPVAVNGKTHDAVYRAVGRGGVVLISEGPRSRTGRMVDEERRKVSRAIPSSGVPITMLSVGPDSDAVPLHKLARRLGRIKPKLTKSEVLAVSNRLSSLNSKLPIPKGIDPTKVRPQRAR